MVIYQNSVFVSPKSVFLRHNFNRDVSSQQINKPPEISGDVLFTEPLKKCFFSHAFVKGFVLLTQEEIIDTTTPVTGTNTCTGYF